MAFTCDICGQDGFKTEAGMKCHKTKTHGKESQGGPDNASPSKNFEPVRKPSQEKTFKCDVCDQNDFKTEAGMKCHKTKIHGRENQGAHDIIYGSKSPEPIQRLCENNSFTCEICGKSDFKTEAGWKCHMTKSHGQKYSSQLNISKTHDAVKSCPQDKTFVCDICGKNDFKTEAGMKCHKTKSHGQETPNQLDFAFQNRTPDQRTKPSQDKTFACDICGKNDFKTEAGMKCHKTKVHEQEDPSQPDIAFQNKTPDQRTKPSHDMTFVCDICGKNDFKSEAGMKGHKTKVHEQEDPSQPDIAFQNKTPDQRTKPSQDKTFACDICGKNDFKTEAGMKCHKTKSHGQETPNQLDTAFSDKLHDPRTAVSQDKTFVCDICGKNDFKTEAGMKCHKARIHEQDMLKSSPIVPFTEMQSEQHMTFLKDETQDSEISSLLVHTTVTKIYVSPQQNCSEIASSNVPCQDGLLKNEDIKRNDSDKHVTCICDQNRAMKEAKKLELPDIPKVEDNVSQVLMNNPSKYITDLIKRLALNKEDIGDSAAKIKDFLESERGFLKKVNEDVGSSGLKWTILRSGSYFDGTKNLFPDEFDFMFFPNYTADIVMEDHMPKGFCKLRLLKPADESMTSRGFLDPAKFKKMAFDLFDQAKGRNAQRQEKDVNSPAFTILYNPGAGGRCLDIDLVPSIEIPRWPRFCKKVAPKWEEDEKFRQKCMEKCHVVAKTCTEEGYEDVDLLWRMSFSWAEKQLIRHANLGNQRKIRKKIFRILKGLLEETKEENKGKIKKLCSFHLKMFMLHQYDAWPHMKDETDYLRDRFVSITETLITILAQNPARGFPSIENYFLKGDNVIRHVPVEETELYRQKLKAELQKVL